MYPSRVRLPMQSSGEPQRAKCEPAGDLFRGSGYEHPRQEASRKRCVPHLCTGRSHHAIERINRRLAQVVEQGHSMDAGNRAVRGTRFDRAVLALEIRGTVLRQWNARVSTLLRAPMDETILANIHVARSCPALPCVGAAVGEVALKQAVMPMRVEAARELYDLFINGPMFRIERHDLTRLAVNQADRCAKTERERALR